MQVSSIHAVGVGAVDAGKNTLNVPGKPTVNHIMSNDPPALVVYRCVSVHQAAILGKARV